MHFDLQPMLRGELVELRPLERADYQSLFDVASDPLIWEQHPAANRYEEPVFRSLFEESVLSQGALVVRHLKSGALIGSSRYHAYSEADSEVEIGWTFLARDYWGGVYNGEIKRLMIKHAFRFVRSVVFLVGPENVRSQRAMVKIGGRRSGIRQDASGQESLVYRVDALDGGD